MYQTAPKECKTWNDWVGKVIYREVCKKGKCDNQTKIRRRECEEQNSLGFWDTNWSSNPDKKTRPCNNYPPPKKKKKEKKKRKEKKKKPVV